MEKDREDFFGLMDTYKLPKSSDEEIKFRKRQGLESLLLKQWILL